MARTVFLPKTVKAGKKLGKRTMKRVRRFIANSTRSIKKIPGYLDRVVSKRLTRRRK
jgi:hypothetical protein